MLGRYPGERRPGEGHPRRDHRRGVRDIDGSREIGFPVFARADPITARGRIMQQSYNTMIQCGGVQVRPGDFVLAWRGV